MKLKTLKPHSYLNKDRKPGDEYEADEKFGRALVDAGIVRRMPYSDREMLPEGARMPVQGRAQVPAVAFSTSEPITDKHAEILKSALANSSAPTRKREHR